MKVSEAIKKYNLIKQEKDCFNDLYNKNVYKNETIKNGVRFVYTVEQDELAKESGEDLYFLIIEKIKQEKTDLTCPSITSKVIELKND